MQVEKTQKFGVLGRFRFLVLGSFSSFSPTFRVWPAADSRHSSTVLILTMETVANGPGTQLQRSSTAKRKIVSHGDLATATAVSI